MWLIRHICASFLLYGRPIHFRKPKNLSFECCIEKKIKIKYRKTKEEEGEDIRQPIFWWCLVDAHIKNKVFRESLFYCQKSIKHTFHGSSILNDAFAAWVFLTKNLQFWEMLQPPSGWQSSLTEKGKLFPNVLSFFSIRKHSFFIYQCFQ